MTDSVNTKRRYRSRLRKDRAEQTQVAILEAARRLFIEQGWTRTTIAAIAREAGVATETIYAVFGNKRALLERLVRDAIRGDAPQTPLLEQDTVQRVADAPGQREQVRLFARSITAILERVAPLIAAARSAAESDPRLIDLYRSLHEGRRRNLAFAAAALAGNGPLRNDMDEKTATDCLFRLASPETFLLMRTIEGKSAEDFAQWLETALNALLLPAESGGQSR